MLFIDQVADKCFDRQNLHDWEQILFKSNEISAALQTQVSSVLVAMRNDLCPKRTSLYVTQAIFELKENVVQSGNSVEKKALILLALHLLPSFRNQFIKSSIDKRFVKRLINDVLSKFCPYFIQNGCENAWDFVILCCNYTSMFCSQLTTNLEADV